MLATRITDHEQQALNRLLQQYRGKPRIEGMIAAQADQFQELENAIFDLEGKCQLFDGTNYPAIGKQLDGIGEIVGIKRNGLSDASYLLFILGRIAENFSDTTIPTILDVIRLLYQPGSTFLREAYPASIAFTVNDYGLDRSLFPIAQTMVAGAIGGGIAISYIARYAGSPGRVPFRCRSIGTLSTPGGGLGGTLSPGVGGQLAGLVFSNPTQ